MKPFLKLVRKLFQTKTNLIPHSIPPCYKRLDPAIYFGFHFNDSYESRTPAEVTGKTFTPGGCLINDPSAPLNIVSSGINGSVDNVVGNWLLGIAGDGTENNYNLDFPGDFEVSWDGNVTKENTASYFLTLSFITGTIRMRITASTSGGVRYWSASAETVTSASGNTTPVVAASDATVSPIGRLTVFPLTPLHTYKLSYTRSTNTITVSVNGVSVSGTRSTTAAYLGGKATSPTPPLYWGNSSGANTAGMRISNGTVKGQNSHAGLTELTGFGKWLLITGGALPAQFTGFNLPASSTFTFSCWIRVLGEITQGAGGSKYIWTKGSWYFAIVSQVAGTSSPCFFRFNNGSVTVQTGYSFNQNTNYHVMVTYANDSKMRLFVNGALVATSNVSTGVTSPASEPCVIGGKAGDTLANYTNWPFAAVADMYMKNTCDATTSFTPPTAPFPDTI